MLVTKQPVLRRFWYPVMPIGHLVDGPKPFRLLGEDIVLWQTAEGQPAAIADRCCHRTAKLSLGFCDRGRIVCAYHGWRYDENGVVVHVPQTGATHESRTAMRVPAFKAVERYGYAWVALDDPIAAVPEFEEATTPGFRKIDQFYDAWNCAGLRLMENSFDMAHIAFVHRNTFGDIDAPIPAKVEVTRCDDGFMTEAEVPVVNRALQKKVLHMEGDITTRFARARWYMPFIRKSQFTYPTGLVHSIVTAATPIDDGRSQIVQFCFRNDTEAETTTEDVIRFDRAIVEEDREILEGTDWDVPLHPRGFEVSIPSDRPGLLIREMLVELLAEHGESEVTEKKSVAA